MNPWLGFALLALSFGATIVFNRLHIDGGTYAATVLGLGVAAFQGATHASAEADAAAARAETTRALSKALSIANGPPAVVSHVASPPESSGPTGAA